MGGSESSQTQEKTDIVETHTTTTVGDIGFTGAQGAEVAARVIDLAKVGVQGASSLGESLVEKSAQPAPAPVIISQPGGREGGEDEQGAFGGSNLPLIIASAAVITSFLALRK